MCIYILYFVKFKRVVGSTRLNYLRPEPDPFNKRVNQVDPKMTWNLFSLNPNLLIFMSVSGRVSCRVENCHPYQEPGEQTWIWILCIIFRLMAEVKKSSSVSRHVAWLSSLAMIGIDTSRWPNSPIMIPITSVPRRHCKRPFMVVSSDRRFLGKKWRYPTY